MAKITSNKFSAVVMAGILLALCVVVPTVLKQPDLGLGSKPDGAPPSTSAAGESKPPVALLEPLHKAMVEAATGGPVHKANLGDGDMAAAKAVVEKYLSGFLKQEGESHFTTSVIGGARKDYEIRGLQIGASQSPFVTEADRLNGIEARLFFSLKASAHRSRKPDATWSEWRPGKPVVNFYGVRLERKAGVWSVVHGPGENYQLPKVPEPSGIFRRRADGSLEKVN